uniref:ATP synthase F0 subunit 6 n=1 Tax=Macropsidius duuschulus TaxID=2479914 RepID=UPI002E76E36E|nr:ATP synthase F0 subunit 6 [Macropsidius duuschulus]WRK21470.1 ATP synthase F0 subunit 6 [Macropsidius duuschulus]
MMMNLFSTFDPCTGIMSLNWISTIVFIMFIPNSLWVKNNKTKMIMTVMLVTLTKEMTSLAKNKSIPIIMMSMFMLILSNNLMGLLPYVFTSSSHLVFSMSLALPLWMSFMIFGWTSKTNHMFAHLVPMGTPMILMPFMVMIETTSNLIRPGSLSVRLSANMIAGHLLMSLLGNNSSKSSIIMCMTMIVCIMLIMFESAVAMIQSYVFMTLSTLYSSEI